MDETMDNGRTRTGGEEGQHMDNRLWIMRRRWIRDYGKRKDRDNIKTMDDRGMKVLVNQPGVIYHIDDRSVPMELRTVM